MAGRKALATVRIHGCAVDGAGAALKGQLSRLALQPSGGQAELQRRNSVVSCTSNVLCEKNIT